MIADLWNIGHLAHRLEWMQELFKGIPHSESPWSNYATLDVEHFHIELRSALDYATALIDVVSDKPGQTPDSFRKLQNWVQKDSNRRRLGEDLATVVGSATWFPDVQEVRDGTVHRGAFAIVFGDPADGILFHIVRPPFTKIAKEHKEFMWNENVIDFKLYAAYYVAELISFLEDLADVVVSRLGYKHEHHDDPRLQAAACSAGFYTLAQWLAELDRTLLE